MSTTQRKLLYVVLILALLAGNTFLWRGVASPLTGNKLPEWTVAARANKLELTDLSTGDADVAGSAARLMLTGSRGLALAVLWYQSDEKKKKHEWNKMELLVNTITKLQPHSPAPWMYQSWNIAYNVSVESDRVKDKFFYIAKGIDLLAQGVRLNRDQPDMRYMLGFYYQNKFGVADETNTFRSLFQLSCIDPRNRDAGKLRNNNVVDLVEFEKFTAEHPQLVRRLKEKLNMSPDAIVDFLRDNKNIPSRFDENAGQIPAGKPQFPTLPYPPPGEPIRTFPGVHTEDSVLGDDFDNYMAARAWFAYAQDPLPDPSPQVKLQERLQVARETGKRIPRAPALVIFRHLPIRAQSFIGERLEKEGWFDATGWNVDEDRSGLDKWFPVGRPVVVGSGNNWNEAAWAKAFEEWETHGQLNGLFFDAQHMKRLEEKAKLFRDKFALTPDSLGPDILEDKEDAAMRESFIAHRTIFFFHSNVSMSNYTHHFRRAEAEKDREAIQARKLLFDAQRLKDLIEPERAMNRYEEGLTLWTKILGRYSEFREDLTLQEDVYELQIYYMDLVAEHRGPTIRPALVAAGLLSGGVTALSGGTAVGLISGLTYASPGGKRFPLPVIGPLDRLAPDGQPWLSPTVGASSRQRLDRDEPEAPPTGPPGAPATTTPPAGAPKP